MERIDLNDLIANSGLDLEVITTTTGRNGYPENLITAVIGFDNFDEAEKFAKENKLELIRVQRKFGHDLWNRMGTAYKELERDGSEFGDDYTVYHPKEYYSDLIDGFDEKMFYKDNVKELVELMDDFAEARKFLDDFEAVSNALSNADDDELVVCEGTCRNMEIIKRHCMQYSYDSTDYAIVAIQL